MGRVKEELSAKYIFLDVDGVLNNKKHYKKQHDKYGGRFNCQDIPFNPRSLKNLYKIVKATNANIVLTSSWRKDNDCMVVLEARLAEYGLKIYDIIDKNTSSDKRGDTIIRWLFNNGDPTLIYDESRPFITIYDYNFIVLDDQLYDMKNDEYFLKYIIKCDPYIGLDWKTTRKAIRKMKEKKYHYERS